MNPQTHDEEVTEQSPSAAVDSEVKDFDQESSQPAQTAHTKVGIDAERIRSSIGRLTSNSTSELEKLIAELERLQEFLKSETERVQNEIGSVLSGIGIIVEAIAPWKTPRVTSAQNTSVTANGRDKLKRWP
jgi:hypothetical protein